MVTILCFGLTSLLIPVLIELCHLQAGLHPTNAGHTIAQVVILCGFYWLIMQILRLDEYHYFRYLLPNEPVSKAAVRKFTVEPSKVAVNQMKRPERELPQEPPLRGPRLRFNLFFKNHRMNKPL